MPKVNDLSSTAGSRPTSIYNIRFHTHNLGREACRNVGGRECRRETCRHVRGREGDDVPARCTGGRRADTLRKGVQEGDVPTRWPRTAVCRYRSAPPSFARCICAGSQYSQQTPRKFNEQPPSGREYSVKFEQSLESCAILVNRCVLVGIDRKPTTI